MKRLRNATIVAMALIIASIFAVILLVPQYCLGWSPSVWGTGGSGSSMMSRAMMGQGAMGGMMGSGMMGFYTSIPNPISHDEAKAIARNYLRSLNNSDLAIDEFEEYSNNFYVSFVEKSSGSYSADIAQAIETVTREQALEIARNFLKVAFPRAEASEIAHYYGYYTIMVTLNGEHYGMLSINAYTGAIWYHARHGMFILEVEK